MNVFIMGGTGSIGTAIVPELIARGHRVTGLSRSELSDATLIAAGARPVRGTLGAPGDWVAKAIAQDAIIQVAATFDDDMGVVDRVTIEAIMAAATQASTPLRMIYTGGCWLYGATGDVVATEDHPFDPLPAFSWMVDHAARLLAEPALNTVIVHPAMVYHAGGGVFDRFLTPARAGQPIEIWGSPDTRWPIIERADLARAYCDLLERPDLVGHFNAVAQQGVRVGEIAETLAAAYDAPRDRPVLRVETLVAQHGAWAKGPTLDQQMSAEKLSAATGWAPVITDYRTVSAFQPGR